MAAPEWNGPTGEGWAASLQSGRITHCGTPASSVGLPGVGEGRTGPGRCGTDSVSKPARLAMQKPLSFQATAKFPAPGAAQTKARGSAVSKPASFLPLPDPLINTIQLGKRQQEEEQRVEGLSH